MKTVTVERMVRVSFFLPWFCSQGASGSENGGVLSQTSPRLGRPGGSPVLWGRFSLPADVTAVGWGKASALLRGPAFRGWPRGWGRRGVSQEKLAESQECGAPAGLASLLAGGCCGTALRVGVETHLRCGLWFPR